MTKLYREAHWESENLQFMPRIYENVFSRVMWMEMCNWDLKKQNKNQTSFHLH